MLQLHLQIMKWFLCSNFLEFNSQYLHDYWFLLRVHFLMVASVSTVFVSVRFQTQKPRTGYHIPWVTYRNVETEYSAFPIVMVVWMLFLKCDTLKCSLLQTQPCGVFHERWCLLSWSRHSSFYIKSSGPLLWSRKPIESNTHVNTVSCHMHGLNIYRRVSLQKPCDT